MHTLPDAIGNNQFHLLQMIQRKLRQKNITRYISVPAKNEIVSPGGTNCAY